MKLCYDCSFQEQLHLLFVNKVGAKTTRHKICTNYNIHAESFLDWYKYINFIYNRVLFVNYIKLYIMKLYNTSTKHDRNALVGVLAGCLCGKLPHSWEEQYRNTLEW